MTRTELDDIKKTLEICGGKEDCPGCPLYLKVESCIQVSRRQALDAIKLLETELIDERYRHDRLQDWTIARDKQHEEQLGRVFEQMRNLCRYHRALRDDDGSTEHLCRLNEELTGILLYRCSRESCPFFPRKEASHAEVPTP